MIDKSFWQGRRVLVTGHTGFKGSWLSIWLWSLGARVKGYALKPPTDPSMFYEANIESFLEESELGDIRDFERVRSSIDSFQPEIIIHMAAQPLVRYSYDNPIETYAVNALGTAHILEAARKNQSVLAVVNITTDKCYENREWCWPYRENDQIGGHDPYSSSKGCAELITSSYQKSFYSQGGIGLASVRAGNVIGGGDWAKDRLIPDFLRAFDKGDVLNIRSPGAIRPWQHVLEPLHGYLILAEKLVTQGCDYSQAWNFGPHDTDVETVSQVVNMLGGYIPSAKYTIAEGGPHEAGLLKLDSSKAKLELGWEPRWNLEEAIGRTVDWHLAWKRGEKMDKYSLQQIESYLLL